MEFYEPPYDDRSYGWVHQSDLPDTERMGDLLASVVKQLYSTSELDGAKLEDELDQLCYLLEIKMHPGDLTIERKRQKVPLCLQNWLQINQTIKAHT
jgi:hypothetical protein